MCDFGFETEKSGILIDFNSGIKQFIICEVVFDFELENFALDTLKVRLDVEESFLFGFSKKLLEETDVHFEPKFDFVVVLILLVDFPEPHDDIN